MHLLNGPKFGLDLERDVRIAFLFVLNIEFDITTNQIRYVRYSLMEHLIVKTSIIL